MQAIMAQKSIDGLIKAERDFAAYSVAHSTKEAFLKFLDSAGVVFENGKAVNGIEAWNKREQRPGILNWWPQFAEISNSKEFGYTTGPWTFQASVSDSVAARGQYTTVWHLDKNGDWKFLIDLGVGRLSQSPIAEVKKINTNPAIRVRRQELVPEAGFIQLFSKDKKAAYKKYLSAESILNRNGQMPAITATDQRRMIDSTSSSIVFEMTGVWTSPGGDMVVTYGTAVLNSKTDNYQRIWRREKKGWKIALEVLRY